MPVWRFTTVLAIGVAAASPLSAEQAAKPKGVVELFTSQGCASCPPADAKLETLIRRPGRAVMRGILEEAVYALDDEIGSNALDAHISRLRRKLEDVAAGIEIRAIRNIGYLLRAIP